MAKKKLDAEVILGKLGELRRSMPFNEASPSRPVDGLMTSTDGVPLKTAEDFEWLAVAEGLESLSDALSAGLAVKRARIEEQALEVYYDAEELAQDPEHAELIPHVQRMREAYEKDHGRPIPPRKKK